jgi:hypothetical protein
VWRDKLATKIMKQRMQASHDGTLVRLALQETSGMCTLCKKCEKPPYASSPGRSPQLFPVPILPADMKTPSELTHSFQYLLYSLSQTFLSLSLSAELQISVLPFANDRIKLTTSHWKTLKDTRS